MSKRRLVELCDVIVPMRDKPKTFVTEEEGIPWCRIEDIEGKFLNDSKSEKYVSRECIKQMHLRVFPAGTVLCAVTGASIGTYAITTRELITNQTFAGLVCKENLLYNEFLYYYIKMHTNAFVNNSVGCAQAYITRETLENILIPDLEYEEQVQLVKVLKYIDDKIKINNRINEELESMARTIYDYWFLQFDFPDENGKPYKSSSGKMVWNEELKREIPEGWEEVKLESVFDFVKGRIPNELFDVKKEGLVNYLTIEAVNEGVSQYCNSDSMIFTNGEVLMVMDGAASSEVYVGNEGALGSTFSKLQVKDNYISDNLLYLIMKKYEKVFKKVNTGSTVPHANKNYIHDFAICMPKEAFDRNRLQNVFDDIIEKIIHAKKENQELASLRDFLLPLLMNGQVGFKK